VPQRPILAQNDAMSARQRRFVAAVVTTRTITEAAEVAKISRRTADRYLADPAVKAALTQALDALQRAVTAAVVGEMGEALATLAEIHADPEAPAGSRVAAARSILTAGPALREAGDLAERLALLEQQLLAGASDE
jgi:phage terminase small subunit